MEHHTIIIDENLSNKRLDIAISEADVGISRRRAKLIIDVGGCYVNKRRVRKASKMVSEGDKVVLDYNLKTLSDVKKNDFEFKDEDILYWDHGIIAVNKPPFLPTQATRTQAVYHVIPCLTKYLQKKGEKPLKLTLVHRLDKETSGVLLVAYTKKSTNWLTEQFRQRETKKIYHCISYGVPPKRKFTEHCYLSKINNAGYVTVTSKGDGKESITHFSTLDAFRKLGFSLIKCELITGRSHQIRVHLQKNGLSIVGDKKYGPSQKVDLPEELKGHTLSHHFLHAEQITFKPTPNSEPVTIKAPYPSDMTELVVTLREHR